ncbi:carbohydrate ABC transporter permease [Crossiella sp. CA198]|uniref:carbohydrate ABC transporter permease n=1 Tax=Crossiella sp. CA198 TaxID=3455607 RepID=UPI003F8D479A
MRESAVVRWSRRLVIVALTGFALTPVYVMITSAVKPLRDVQGPFTAWPSVLTLEPFREMWRTVPLARYFLNSAVVALGATACSMLIAILAAYSLSRYRFRGRGAFLTALLSTQMFPGILFLLPLFLLFVNLDRVTGLRLFGSQAGLIITYLTFALPGVAAVAIYSFMTAWSEVLFASVLTTADTRTLAVGLRGYATQSSVYWNQVMAASLVVSIPVVLGFLLLQKALVR